MEAVKGEKEMCEGRVLLRCCRYSIIPLPVCYHRSDFSLYFCTIRRDYKTEVVGNSST